MASSTAIPTIYKLFFLWIEPIATLAGAYMAFWDPQNYSTLTHAASTSSPIPLVSQIVLYQLANLYFLFAFNEALVLRATSDLKVWRTFLLGMLIADFGHLWTVASVDGPGAGLLNIAGWNAMGWGNIAFVYVGASMRSSFLLGLGFGKGQKKLKA